MKKFLIVCFPEEGNSIGIVPRSWCIGETESYWPPFATDARIRKAIRILEKPEESWTRLKIRCLGSKGNIYFIL